MDNTENVNIKLLRNVKEITDFDASELDVYARLTEAQLFNKDHPEKGLFIAESPKVITRALDGGYEPVSVLVEKKQASYSAQLIKSKKIILRSRHTRHMRNCWEQ